MIVVVEVFAKAEVGRGLGGTVVAAGLVEALRGPEIGLGEAVLVTGAVVLVGLSFSLTFVV